MERTGTVFVQSGESGLCLYTFNLPFGNSCTLGLLKRGSLTHPIGRYSPTLSSVKSQKSNQSNFSLRKCISLFFYLKGTVGVISIVTLHAKMAMSDLQRFKETKTWIFYSYLIRQSF